MKRYFSLYKKLTQFNLTLFFAYRSTVINQLIATSVWTGLIITTMLIITARAKNVAGWTQPEMLLLTGSLLIILGLFELHFKRSFQQMPDTILYGNLDDLLLKPIDSQFLLSYAHMNIFGLWRVLVGVGFSISIIQRFHILIHAAEVFGYLVCLLAGLVIYYCIWFILSTLLIWFPRLSNILDVANSLNHVSRFPPEMYREFSSLLYFFLLPYMFITATPVHILLNRANAYDIGGLCIVSIGMLILSRLFWQFALRSYTSASG